MTVTDWIIVVPIAILVLTWIGGEIYILCRYGRGSGRTISWRFYEVSKKYPVIPLLIGLVVGFFLGHVYAGMPGVAP